MFCLDEYQVENAVKSAMETFDAMFKNKDTNILTPEYIADIFNQMKSMPLEVQMGIVVHMCKDTTICSAVNTQQAYMDWLVTNRMARRT